MCCVYSPTTTVSTTSSQRGQIVSSDRPPPYSADRPLRSDEGFDGRPAKPYLAESDGGDADAADRIGERRAPCVNADGEFDAPAAKRLRAESDGGDGDAAAADQDRRDRISELPDAILLCILSYLPLRDAARSTALSSRWRRLFDQSLLDFDACQPFPPEAGRGCEWFIRAVDSILAARRHIRVRSFRFVMYGQGFHHRMGIVSGWFPILAGCGVREVDVDMLYTSWKPTLPASLLQLASLETLRVCYCDLPKDGEVDALRLPALKTLQLSKVRTSDDALQAILSNCSSLECAKLKNIDGVKQIRLRSKSLVRLYGDFSNLIELVVEYAPSLEELVGIHLPSSRATVKILSAPKLQVLGYLGKNARPLVLHDTVFDGGILQSSTLMHSVKTLAIQVPFSEKGHTTFVAQLLKCFPRLEALHVEADNRSVSQQVTPESWDTATSIQCIEHSLNKLVFENFGGQRCQWTFLSFLLEMAKTLKVVELYCLKGEDCASSQIKLLSSINRLYYPGVEFLFFTSCEQVNGLYLCRCCPRRCQNENRVSLLPCPKISADGYSEAPEE